TFTEVHPYSANRMPDDPEQGYQRPPEGPRIKKFANWLRQEAENDGKVRMPTAILLSGRGANVHVSQTGTITLSEENKLPLIDGQHRTRGFEYAFRDKGMTQFAD